MFATTSVDRARRILGIGALLKEATMTRTATLERFATLAARRGISPGVLYSANHGDFMLVMAAAANAFVPLRNYAEREVNAVLIAWLGGAGAMLDVDHVELRRWLVDTRILDRDGYGRAYVRGTPIAEIAALIDEMSGVDLVAIARDARTRDERRREERRSRWMQRQSVQGS
jgi:hypothetical protein